MRRISAPMLVAVLALTFVASGLPASASPNSAVPAPTVTVTTRVAGQTLPASPVRGAWTVSRPGRQATLNIAGPVASPSVTTVRSTWFSTWRWVRRQKVAFGASVDTNFTDVASGSDNNAFRLVIDARTRGHHWEPVVRVVGSHNTQVLLNAGQGIGMEIGFFNRVRLQWRVRLTATFYDTSDETLTETLKQY